PTQRYRITVRIAAWHLAEQVEIHEPESAFETIKFLEFRLIAFDVGESVSRSHRAFHVGFPGLLSDGPNRQHKDNRDDVSGCSHGSSSQCTKFGSKFDPWMRAWQRVQSPRVWKLWRPCGTFAAKGST